MTEVEARERPELRVLDRLERLERRPAQAAAAAAGGEPAAALPPAQMLIDAVTQLEANKKDVTPKGFQKRLQLSYAIFDQATLMMQEIEAQHAKLVRDLTAVDRRSPLAQNAA